MSANPHKSWGKLVKAREAKAGRVARHGKALADLYASDAGKIVPSKKRQQKITEGQRLRKRGFLSGMGYGWDGTHTEGPVGRLPNPALWWLVRNGENVVVCPDKAGAQRLLKFYRAEFPQHKWSIKQTSKAKTRNIKPLANSFFGPEAIAGAKRVKKIRRVASRHSAGSGRQEAGEIVSVLPGGWLKVKWDNRERPTLIKRSEIKRYPYVRNSAGYGWTVAEVKRQLPSVPVRVRGTIKTGIIAGRLRRFASVHVGQQSFEFAWETIVNALNASRPLDSGIEKNPGLMELAGGMQALEYLASKAGPSKVKGKRQKANPNSSRTSTSSDVRSPTRTSTSTKAKTTGNVTVTGGAGAGATTSVTIRRNPNQFTGSVTDDKLRAKARQLLKTYQWTQEKPDLVADEIATQFGYDAKVSMRRTRAAVAFVLKEIKSTRNPSVSAMSRTFQGSASGEVEQYYASDYAPRLDFSRGGKLVFLKLAGKTIRVPSAVVAIDPKTSRLWVAGSNARPMFSRKAARKGELLDYGALDAICYLTSKKHVGGGKPFEYVHNFGEEGGRKPTLQIDHDGMPVIKGGDYKIEARGIVN